MTELINIKLSIKDSLSFFILFLLSCTHFLKSLKNEVLQNSLEFFLNSWIKCLSKEIMRTQSAEYASDSADWLLAEMHEKII